jgi:hypothetical protein
MEKKIFGVLLTVLGIGGLIWAAYDFVAVSSHSHEGSRAIWAYAILGLVFFFSGIGLLRHTEEKKV